MAYIHIIMCVLNAVLIVVFEPSTITGVTDIFKGTPLASLLQNTTFLGMLAQTFYSFTGLFYL